MGQKIIIQAGSVRAEAELNESTTARLIWESLPIETRANTWGDEVYFDIPVKTGLENGVEVVNVGDLGYWPSGPAFCIFFGPTPVSRGNEIRPASAVTIVGKVLGDARIFRDVSDGEKVTLARSE